MPDLNLIDDEGGLEESPAPTPAAAPKKKPSSGSGGGSKTILILLILVVVAAVVVFYLNKRGIIHLWGKKPAQVVEMQEEVIDPEMAAEGQEAFPEGSQQQVVPADTQQVALLETPPVDEYTPVSPTGEETKPAMTEAKPEPANALKPDPIKPDPKSLGAAIAPPNRIGEMKGEFTAQVGAFKEEAKANEIVQLLAEGGYPAFVQRVPMKSADWYTVCIGKYGSRDEAKKAVENSAEQIRSQYVITRVRGN
jgi:cell division septation protein DedD